MAYCKLTIIIMERWQSSWHRWQHFSFFRIFRLCLRVCRQPYNDESIGYILLKQHQQQPQLRQPPQPPQRSNNNSGIGKNEANSPIMESWTTEHCHRWHFTCPTSAKNYWNAMPRRRRCNVQLFLHLCFVCGRQKEREKWGKITSKARHEMPVPPFRIRQINGKRGEWRENVVKIKCD